ncbi:hypothetical protein DD237_003768 [Peronospora effusa]|uniref:Potassium channel domain-containing protein n=1 Tax=Peronospora effusa TaxID=542832 RepID=A0A3R7W794_9STRA|nr:hypothetical protein DD237_003768 [Peronospora effusa]
MLAASFFSLRPRCGSLGSVAIGRTRRLQQIRLNGFVCRALGTSASDSKDQKLKTTILDRVVDKLNDSIRNYPGETISVLFASDILSIGAMYGAISMVGIEFSPEFALAFAASRPFRRFRLPLDLVVAAGVAKAFPAFSRVRLSDLTRALPNRTSASASSAILKSGIMAKAMDTAKEVIDNYGAAYMMGSRLAGVGVVCALYGLIKQGVDLMPILACLGVEEVGSALGGYAAAVVLSSALYPATLGVSGYIAPVVAKLRRTALSQLWQCTSPHFTVGTAVSQRSEITCINRAQPKICARSIGICELNVWQGTRLDDDVARSGRPLLRPNLPVIKCKNWTQRRFPESPGNPRNFFNLSLQTLSSTDWKTRREEAVLLRLETRKSPSHFAEVLCLSVEDFPDEVVNILCHFGRDFRLEVELVHNIAGSSPFFNKTLDDLARSDFIIILLVSGLDENLHDMVYTKQEYSQEAMRWGARFLPALNWDYHHKFIKFDLGKISAVAPVPIDLNDGLSSNVDVTCSPEKEEYDLLTSCNEVGNVDIEHASQHSSRCFQADRASPSRLVEDTPFELGNDYDDGAAAREASKGCQRDEDKPDGSSSSNGMAQVGRHVMQRDSLLSYWSLDDEYAWGEKLGGHSMSILQRKIRVKNRSHSFLLKGVYQRALEASWPSLLLSLVLAYLWVVATLALLISISIHDPLDQREQNGFTNKFGEVFFFCVQTISTVGYGALSPRQDSDAANFFVFLLVFSGITWAKFSIPKASTLLYSNVLLLNSFHSHRAVMFRAANNRKFGVIVEGSFRYEFTLDAGMASNG